MRETDPNVRCEGPCLGSSFVAGPVEEYLINGSNVYSGSRYACLRFGRASSRIGGLRLKRSVLDFLASCFGSAQMSFQPDCGTHCR